MIWKANDGKSYHLYQMDTGHIQNCIIKLTEKIEACRRLYIGEFTYNGYLGTAWVSAFRTELIKRGITPTSRWVN